MSLLVNFMALVVGRAAASRELVQDAFLSYLQGKGCDEPRRTSAYYEVLEDEMTGKPASVQPRLQLGGLQKNPRASSGELQEV